MTYTPAANTNGSAIVTVQLHDDGGTANGGSDSSATQTFAINVTAVNDAPSFVVGGAQTVDEDAGAQTVNGFATSILAGPSDESTQTLSFSVSNSNSGLFSVQPSIDSTGQLTYTPAANANGSAIVTVQLHDNGGTANGGADTSAAQTFAINVTAVNDAPSFVVGANQTVNEDAGARTVNGFATSISAGPSNESTQALNFLVSNSNSGLFSVQPSVSSNGTLTYTPAANANGSAIVTVLLHDNGGTANGGADTSAAQTFSINVTAVNDAPSFVGGGNQSILATAGAQSVNGFATSLSAGPSNESTQALNFIVSNSNSGLFSVQPTIDSTGKLTYTPSTSGNGSAIVTVQLHDNGGTTNGGLDTSAAQSFQITVTAVNQPPVVTTSGVASSYTEQVGSVVVDSLLQLNDADSNVQSVSLTIASATPTETLLFTNQGGFTGSYNASTGTFTLTPTAGSAAASAFVPLLRTIRYQNTGDNPAAQRTILISATDVGANTSNTASQTINITTINDAPVNTVSGSRSAIQVASISLTGLSVSDVDANNAIERVTFSVTKGSLSLNSTVAGGVAAGAISGNNTGTVTLSGTLTAINLTLDAVNGLLYTPKFGYTGPDNLMMVTNDLGNTGNVINPLTDTDYVALTVSALKAPPPPNVLPPVVTMSSTGNTYTENVGTTVVDGGLLMNDKDSNVQNATVKILSPLATDLLLFTNQNGATGSYNALTGSLSIGPATVGTTFTPAIMQSLLRSVRFQNSGDNPTQLSPNRTITFAVTDTASNVSNVGSQTVTIAAVNDAPVNTIPKQNTAHKNTPMSITGVSINDADNNGFNEAVTLAVNSGSLTISTSISGGVGLGDVGVNAAGQVRITASLAKINATLANPAGLTFTPKANTTGYVQFQVITNDLGNTGSGGAKTTSTYLASNIAVVSPQTLAAGFAGTVNTLLTPSDLAPVVAQAIGIWSELGLNSQQQQLLSSVAFVIGNYDDARMLGYVQDSSTVHIDDNAVGMGWYINRSTMSPDPAIGQPKSNVDLLTVVLHELGHVIGLDDNDSADDLMAWDLGSAVARRPTLADVRASDAALAKDDTPWAIATAPASVGPGASSVAVREAILSQVTIAGVPVDDWLSQSIAMYLSQQSASYKSSADADSMKKR